MKIARSVQIKDRGALLPGFWADVLVYDLDSLYFDTHRYEFVASTMLEVHTSFFRR